MALDFQTPQQPTGSLQILSVVPIVTNDHPDQPKASRDKYHEQIAHECPESVLTLVRDGERIYRTSRHGSHRSGD